MDPEYKFAWANKGDILKILERNNEALEASHKFFLLILLLDIINVLNWILNIAMHEIKREMH